MEVKVVYLLQHSYENEEGSEVKILGVFSSKQNAEAAIDSMIRKPGFSSYPDGFHIDELILDSVFWQDGFSTMVLESL